MKVVSRSNQRITIFWNYASDKVTINEQNDIKIIAEYREKLLLMVKQGKLTNDEYDKFRKSIGKMNIGKFVDCIFISNLIFDIPRCELLDEIKNFFENYKTLQKIEVKVGKYHNKEDALELIEACKKRYKDEKENK